MAQVMKTRAVTLSHELSKSLEFNLKVRDFFSQKIANKHDQCKRLRLALLDSLLLKIRFFPRQRLH